MAAILNSKMAAKERVSQKTPQPIFEKMTWATEQKTYIYLGAPHIQIAFILFNCNYEPFNLTFY